MNIFSTGWIVDMLLRLPAVLWALSFHEFCHGWAAYKLGDRTAAMQGRLSLNPLDHLDPIGTLMLIFFRFGWAKPVPINSRYFRNPRRDIAIVSLAGAAGNFLSAFVCMAIFKFFPVLLLKGALSLLLMYMVYMNIGLGVFNLIPIPPLDGSKVLSVFLPPSMAMRYFFLERYGMFIILFLMLSGSLGIVMMPVMRTVIRLFSFLLGGVNYL
jgi:Zn-dependent protease